MIDRRTLLLALATIPLIVPVAAQQPRPLLAILSPKSRDAAVARLVNIPFMQALVALGWEAGRTIEIVERFADGDERRLPSLAAELVALQPRVLFTNTSQAAVAAARATRDIPIVVGPAGEAILVELAGGSLARPTTNVTGFVLTSPEIDDKCISLLIEASPTANRIGVLVNPRNPGHRHYPVSLGNGGIISGKTLVRIECNGLADIDNALVRALSERIGALFVADDALIAADPEVRKRILRLAMLAKMPIASSHKYFAHDGALIAMGPSIPALAAAAAGYVHRILRGARPAELPVQLPTTFELIINLKTARTLGLTIPPSILIRANEVIE